MLVESIKFARLGFCVVVVMCVLLIFFYALGNPSGFSLDKANTNASGQDVKHLF
jgi:hypothetical protein